MVRKADSRGFFVLLLVIWTNGYFIKTFRPQDLIKRPYTTVFQACGTCAKVRATEINEAGHLRIEKVKEHIFRDE